MNHDEFHLVDLRSLKPNYCFHIKHSVNLFSPHAKAGKGV